MVTHDIHGSMAKTRELKNLRIIPLILGIVLALVGSFSALHRHDTDGIRESVKVCAICAAAHTVSAGLAAAVLTMAATVFLGVALVCCYQPKFIERIIAAFDSQAPPFRA